MRFFHPVILVLAATTATANTLHQHKRGSYTDICANVDADLVVTFSSTPLTVGHIDLCLCVSEIPTILHSDMILESIVNLVGETDAADLVTAMINAAPDHETCYFPDHAISYCTENNVCDFTCNDGFTPSPSTHPTDCVCELPGTVCNGVCGYFPHCTP